MAKQEITAKQIEMAEAFYNADSIITPGQKAFQPYTYNPKSGSIEQYERQVFQGNKGFEKSVVDARIQAVMDHYAKKPASDADSYESFRKLEAEYRSLEKQVKELVKPNSDSSARQDLQDELNDKQTALNTHAVSIAITKALTDRKKISDPNNPDTLVDDTHTQLERDIETKERLLSAVRNQTTMTNAALEAHFKHRARLRNFLIFFFGFLGGLAGLIYAGAFMSGILAPDAGGVDWMASDAFKFGYMGLFGAASIGIEVYCCAIGLPLLVDWLLSFIMPRDYEEYLDKKLSAVGYKIVYEYDETTQTTQQVLKKKFREPWFKWLTRVITAPVLLVGIMAGNAFGTLLFVRGEYNKIFQAFGIPLELAAVFSWIPGVIMSIASLVFNLRRAIMMLPTAEYGVVKKDGTWASLEIEEKAAKYENMSLLQWVGKGIVEIGTFFTWMKKNPRTVAKNIAKFSLALLLGGALAIVTIAGLQGVIAEGLKMGSVLNGAPVLSASGWGLFGTLCACIGITQFLAVKGSLGNLFAPKEVSFYDEKTGVYKVPGNPHPLYTAKRLAQQEKMPFDKIGDFFSAVLDWRIHKNAWSTRDLFRKTGQWLTANKAMAQMIGVGFPAVVKAIGTGMFLSFATGVGAGTPAGWAVTLGVVALILAFGFAYFVLYNFDTRGDRTMEGGLAAFCRGMNVPFQAMKRVGAWCVAAIANGCSYLYHRASGKQPLGSDDAKKATLDSGLGGSPVAEIVVSAASTDEAAASALTVSGTGYTPGVDRSPTPPTAAELAGTAPLLAKDHSSSESLTLG